MLTTHAYLLPSVPTMLIDEQRGDVTEMIEAVEAAGQRSAAESPAAIVVVSARWSSPDAFHVDDARRHRSVVDLPTFGVEPRYDCTGYQKLARAIVARAVQLGVRAAVAKHGTDSGASVPLHFFARGRQVPVVPLSISTGTREEHRAWGAAIRHALHDWDEPVQFVVGGALSWHLHAFNLRREVPACADLDERVLAALRDGHWEALAGLAAKPGRTAHAEAGLRHLEVLRGFLFAGDVMGTVLEREQLPGIGSALVEFPVVSETGDTGD